MEEAKELERAEAKAKAEADQVRLATLTEILQRVIQTLEEGKVPEVYTGTETLPFWLHRNEALIYCQNWIEYAETNIRREYEGTSGGVSFPMAGNTYFHSGDSWGISEEREVIAQVYSLSPPDTYSSQAKSETSEYRCAHNLSEEAPESGRHRNSTRPSQNPSAVLRP